jgi:hypothetical protein
MSELCIRLNGKLLVLGESVFHSGYPCGAIYRPPLDALETTGESNFINSRAKGVNFPLIFV